MSSVKKKLAFVDLAVHEKTKSTEFVMDLFRDQFDVVNVWYDYGSREKEFIEEIKEFDNIFLLQILLPYSTLIKFQKEKKNIIWAPMYDGLPMSYYYWQKIASTQIKILSFSEGIDIVCRKHQIDYVSVRYHKKPTDHIQAFNKDKYILFFWYRGSIRFTDWIKLFPLEMIEKVYYYSAPLGSSFKNEEIAEEDMIKYKVDKIALQEFSVNRNIFLEYLEKTDIFICPRKQDGIGLPLIEGLSFGKFLVGHNDYTMKDYIRHNQNGFLYNIGSTEQVSVSVIENSTAYRIQFAKEGYENWEKDKGKVKQLYNTFNFTPVSGIGLKVYLIMLYEFAKKIAKKILKKK
jgi:Glycosyl transferases group 1